MSESPSKTESSFRDEILWFWQRWPGKALWAVLAVAWIVIFHFLGNSTFGYIDTSSLFRWMQYAYNNSPDDEHGFLIPFVVVGLLWWKRRELFASIEGIWWPGLALVVLAIGVHFVAYVVQQTRVSIFAFYFGLYALMGFVWGRRFLVASFFPMALFIFTIPLATVSEVITYPLRILVTKIAVAIGHGVLAMDVARNGSQIVNGQGVPMYDVAPACSGIRSLTALGAITMIYAFVSFRSSWRRIVILLSAIPIAVAGNVGRVTAVMTLGDVFGKEQAMRLEQYLGMVTFLVAMALLFGLGRWLQAKDRTEKGSESGEMVGLTIPQARAWLALAVGLVLLAGTSGLLARVGANQRLGKPGLKVVNEPTFVEGGSIIRTNSVYLPPEVLEYTSIPREITPLEVTWLPKDTLYGRRLYRGISDGHTNDVQLSVVLMGTDRTSIHKPQYCLDGQGWKIDRSEVASVPIQQPYPYDLRVMKLTSTKYFTIDGKLQPIRGVYVYWFVADNQLTPFHGERMWWMARDLIQKGVLQRWAYVSYFTACLPGFEDATFSRLKDLIAASVPQFQLAAGEKSSISNTASAEIFPREKLKQ